MAKATAKTKQATTTEPVKAKPTRRRRNRPEPHVPLGSLTQVPAREQRTCHVCGSHRVTSMALQLTDGTPVQFTSCHKCEARRWEHNGEVLSKETVLARTRRA